MTLTDHGYRVVRTQVWEFAPDEVADEEHAIEVAAATSPDDDDLEVEELEL